MKGAVLGLLTLCGLAACGPSPLAPGALDTGARNYHSKDYDMVEARWTEHARLRQGFDLALDVHATYLAWDLRDAQVARLTKSRALTSEEAEVERARNLDEVGKYADFVVVLQSHFESFASLLDRRKKVWTLGLVSDDDRVVRPIEIKSLRSSPDMDMLYPASAEAFTSTYLVRFPASSADGKPLLDAATTRKFTLRIAGAPGRLDVVFDTVAPSAAAPP